MHQAELKLYAKGAGPLYQIAGTLLIADGERVSHTAAAEQLGTAPSGKGVIPSLLRNSGHDVPLPASTADICNAHDIVCDPDIHSFLSGVKVHTSYASSPLLTQAADWLANLLRPPRFTIVTTTLPNVRPCSVFAIPISVVATGEFRFSGGVSGMPPYLLFDSGFAAPQTSPAVYNKVGTQIQPIGVTGTGFGARGSGVAAILNGSDMQPGTYDLDLELGAYDGPLTLPGLLNAGVSVQQQNYALTVAEPEPKEGEEKHEAIC